MLPPRCAIADDAFAFVRLIDFFSFFFFASSLSSEDAVIFADISSADCRHAFAISMLLFRHDALMLLPLFLFFFFTLLFTLPV